VLIDPAVPPPGSLTATFGTGLTVSGEAVVSVDFGVVPGKVAPGEKLLGAPSIDTSGAVLNDALRFDGVAFKPQALSIEQIGGVPWSTPLAPTTIETEDATETTLASIAIAPNRSYHFFFIVGASRDDLTTVTWWILGSAHVDGSGVITLGDKVIVASNVGSHGMSATVDAPLASIRIRGTGPDATDVRWSVSGMITSREN
jgi:hypothetical protein